MALTKVIFLSSGIPIRALCIWIQFLIFMAASLNQDLFIQTGEAGDKPS